MSRLLVRIQVILEVTRSIKRLVAHFTAERFLFGRERTSDQARSPHGSLYGGFTPHRALLNNFVSRQHVSAQKVRPMERAVTNAAGVKWRGHAQVLGFFMRVQMIFEVARAIKCPVTDLALILVQLGNRPLGRSVGGLLALVVGRVIVVI